MGHGHPGRHAGVRAQDQRAQNAPGRPPAGVSSEQLVVFQPHLLLEVALCPSRRVDPVHVGGGGAGRKGDCGDGEEEAEGGLRAGVRWVTARAATPGACRRPWVASLTHSSHGRLHGVAHALRISTGMQVSTPGCWQRWDPSKGVLAKP